MPYGFQIEDSTLVRYLGGQDDVEVPAGVTTIGACAFQGLEDVFRVTIPEGVTAIEDKAFEECQDLVRVDLPSTLRSIGRNAFGACKHLRRVDLPTGLSKIGEGAFDSTGLRSVTIPSRVRKIEGYAFARCWQLESVSIPGSVRGIGEYAFFHCKHLASVIIPKGVKVIGERAFDYCKDLAEVTIPDGVTTIGEGAFCECVSLTSVALPDSVKEIGPMAFSLCRGLTSFVVPPKVRVVGNDLFANDTSLASVTIPEGVTEIGGAAFWSCTGLAELAIPDSVTKIGREAFHLSTATVICGEGSCAHDYCVKNHVSFIFDYQYEAFGGLLPQGFEMLASPFLADEERPFVFISYSHKDRDRVLGIIKGLYEAGWRIWYDEGLTIGDRYDETLEAHVRDCAAFLLFVTESSLESLYVRENEIPWARYYGKPIVKCVLDKGLDYDTTGATVVATVGPDAIEPALAQVDGLSKGERREAKGISVAFNPADRQMAGEGGPGEGGFAYCLYSSAGTASAQAIVLEARNAGCSLYDAVRDGADEDRLTQSACLVVFLDRAFLADRVLARTLIEAYESGRDIAVCQLEDLEDDELPEELLELRKMQWLYFARGITADMNTKLARHLQRRGCRDAAVLPGLDYERTDAGIVIKRYTGVDPSPRIEAAYGGTPVVEIANDAFKGCARLESITIPDGVRRIGMEAFMECTGLRSVSIPGSVREIGLHAFKGCYSLESVDIPRGVTEIGPGAFVDCTGLTSATLPEGLDKVVGLLFCDCRSLTSVDVPKGVEAIERMAFEGCTSLTSVRVPRSVKRIDQDAFARCPKLTVSCPPFSYASKYCREHRIRRG